MVDVLMNCLIDRSQKSDYRFDDTIIETKLSFYKELV